jgi:hypothetical protein
MKKIIFIFLIIITLFIAYFAYLKFTSNNTVALNEEKVRADCHKKYDSLFKQSSEVNNPLSYDKTNPKLYDCIKKLNDPLNIL